MSKIKSATRPNAVPTSWLLGLLYTICGMAFLFDMARDNTFAYGIVYVPLVASAVYHRNRSTVWILAAIACFLVLVGALFPVISSDLPDMIGNRVLSIVAIIATAVFVRHARVIQDRLAAQTRRAEAAERVKQEVLTNLSQDMRGSLHGLLAVLNLMIPGCRPDQRDSLLRVRGSGRQLLDSIDNLVDLSEFEERPLQPQSIDVATILRDAATRAAPVAEERNIAVETTRLPDSDAWGDAWATTRIIDNLIVNAIRFSPAGGRVCLSAERQGNFVVMTVNDAGNGLPPDLRRYFQDDETGELPATGGTGLNLSNRLARAMDGYLAVDDSADAGIMISLALPAAR
jgi:signal transduction histidine kinase